MRIVICSLESSLGSDVSIGSFLNWLNSCSDLISDIAYYIQIPMATPVVQYLMLTSILFPHVYNLVTISLVRS
jgi:hypothetical protein